MSEPMAVPAPDRRQSRCPACGDARGVPLSITYASGVRSLTLHCPVCAHSWTHEPLQFSVVNRRVEQGDGAEAP